MSELQIENWDEAKALGAAIKRERMAHGWSKAELSRQASMNASTVGLIEAGRQKPYPVQLKKISEALGVTFEIERF